MISARETRRARTVVMGLLLASSVFVPAILPLGKTKAASPAVASTACAAPPVPATTTTTSTTTTSTTTTLAPGTTSSSSTTTTAGSSTASSSTTTTAGSSTTSSITSSTTTTSTAPTTSTSSTTTTTIPPTPPAPAYDLVTSAGDVQTFGGAGFFGSRVSQGLSASVIGGISTFDGLGYWLFSTTGDVFTYGDATNYGSPRAMFGGHARRIRAFSATPDGQGYWAVTPAGNVYNFGDAEFCGSAVGLSRHHQVAAIAPTPDGQGYWLVTTNGVVSAYGDAQDFHGSWIYRSKFPIVAIAPTPDGQGYWLCNARGAVYNFGDAPFLGSVIHHRLTRPVVDCVATPDGRGYWLTTGTGRIYFFGDASSHGSDLRNPPRPPTSIVGMIRTIATSLTPYVPLPHHVLGYDISNYQCNKSGSSTHQAGLPAQSSISVLEVAGWLDGAYDTCLKSSATWASAAAGGNGASYELYLFLNSPGTNIDATRLYANGPKGSCGSLSGPARLDCIAYNYGYNGAQHAFEYATKLGVHSVIWWLDIENKTLSPTTFSNFSANEFWSGSTALNAETVRGALEALRADGVAVGIYSSSLQFPKIVGSWQPSGSPIPLWIAGVPWTKPPYHFRGLPSTAALSNWCAGSATYAGSTSPDVFAGGVPWILQETPGTANAPFGLDPDYTC